MGLVIKYSSLAEAHHIKDLVSFDPKMFFNFLLPPIILQSGYNMRRANFFKRFGTILVFAIIGTFISTLVIGTLLHLVQSTGLFGFNVQFLECIIIGAILSSTDPVSILAGTFPLTQYSASLMSMRNCIQSSLANQLLMILSLLFSSQS